MVTTRNRFTGIWWLEAKDVAQDGPTTENHLAQNVSLAKAEQPSLGEEPGILASRSWSWAGSALPHPLFPKVVHKASQQLGGGQGEHWLPSPITA